MLVRVLGLGPLGFRGFKLRQSFFFEGEGGGRFVFQDFEFLWLLVVQGWKAEFQGWKAEFWGPRLRV